MDVVTLSGQTDHIIVCFEKESFLTILFYWTWNIFHIIQGQNYLLRSLGVLFDILTYDRKMISLNLPPIALDCFLAAQTDFPPRWTIIPNLSAHAQQ